MTAARRRRALLVAAALLIAALAGGRWLALETAERAWAATLPGGVGAVYLYLRGLARLVWIGMLILAVAWGTLHVYVVYRSIGSVQMPRRLGDLEIVEAVPQPVLLGITLATGTIFGLALAWLAGAGDWWRALLLAAAPPRFGVFDPVLHRDVGYYLGVLPWAHTRYAFALLSSVAALVLVAVLYAGIGSLRLVQGRPVAGPHARRHLGVLLACVAAALAWGALLDPAEVVAGMHGPADDFALNVRAQGAPVVAVLAVAAGLASLAWAWRERATLLAGAWAALVATLIGVYGLLPSIARAARGKSTPPSYVAERAQLERLAFGWDSVAAAAPPGVADPAATLDRLPLWDATRVALVAGARSALGAHASVAAATLDPTSPGAGEPAGAGGGPRWLVVPAPDDSSLGALRPPPSWDEVHRGSWAHVGAPLAALERDSGLEFRPLPEGLAPRALWFGYGFGQFAVLDDSTPPGAGGLEGRGIPLDGRWRRLALAWTLQSPELARLRRAGARLLWRRDARARLERLAPFARFDAPAPVLVGLPAGGGGALWWLAPGAVASATAPLVRPLPLAAAAVRYYRAGLIGAVNGVTGETRLWLAPGADSLTVAWARLLTPLVQPAESIPAALRTRLPSSGTAFGLTAAALARQLGDTLIGDPFVTVTAGPGEGGRLWIAQRVDSAGAGGGLELLGLFAATMDSGGGPRLFLWRPAVRQAPPPVLGDADSRPGVLRLWPVRSGTGPGAGGGGTTALLTLQPKFAQPMTGSAVPRLREVYVSVGDRQGAGATKAAAWRDLLATGPLGTPADTSLRAAWREAAQLADSADAALAAGRLEEFAGLYRRLSRLLTRRKLAPAP